MSSSLSPRVQRVIQIVSSTYGVNNILSPEKRTKTIVRARKFLCHFLKYRFNYSNTELSEILQVHISQINSYLRTVALENLEAIAIDEIDKDQISKCVFHQLTITKGTGEGRFLLVCVLPELPPGKIPGDYYREQGVIGPLDRVTSHTSKPLEQGIQVFQRINS